LRFDCFCLVFVVHIQCEIAPALGGAGGRPLCVGADAQGAEPAHSASLPSRSHPAHRVSRPSMGRHVAGAEQFQHLPLASGKSESCSGTHRSQEQISETGCWLMACLSVTHRLFKVTTGIVLSFVKLVKHFLFPQIDFFLLHQ